MYHKYLGIGPGLKNRDGSGRNRDGTRFRVPVLHRQVPGRDVPVYRLVPGFGSYLHVADLAVRKAHFPPTTTCLSPEPFAKTTLVPVPVCPGSVPVGPNRFRYPFRSSNPDPGPIPTKKECRATVVTCIVHSALLDVS